MLRGADAIWAEESAPAGWFKEILLWQWQLAALVTEYGPILT
jgi:hypothetical protein